MNKTCTVSLHEDFLHFHLPSGGFAATKKKQKNSFNLLLQMQNMQRQFGVDLHNAQKYHSDVLLISSAIASGQIHPRK